MKRYRILKNARGEYKAQVRGWDTFWFYEDLGTPNEYSWRIVHTSYFSTYGEAEKFAIRYLNKKSALFDIWEVVNK